MTAPTRSDRPAQGWMPIETAPKDGNWLWVAEQADDLWFQSEAQWDGYHWETSYGERIAPSYWMPLPSEPRK